MPELELTPPKNPPAGTPVAVPGNVNVQMPLFYFNGFALQFGSGDFTLTLKVDNHPQMALKMSYTVGKTLSQALTKLVDDFERITSHEVMTSEEVKNYINTERENATRGVKKVG